MDFHVASDLAAVANDDMTVEDGAGADLDVRFDHRERPDVNAFAQERGRVDDCGRVNSGFGSRRRRAEGFRDDAERSQRIADDDDR